MTPQLVITEDGSSSIFIAEFSEFYHSFYGALQESMHVFIKAGLCQKMNRQQEIAILEAGFGTGLNTLLSAIEAESHSQKISYTAVEKFPLDADICSHLNYCSLLQSGNCQLLFDSIHESTWENEQIVSPYFNLCKLRMNIEDISFCDRFDLIYFDAFAPSAQPELWTDAIFTTMFNALKEGGILVTYCAKGEVKRTMKRAGFTLESLAGPKGKREMTRATKISIQD